MAMILKSLTITVCAGLLAACGSHDAPHSDYFVVNFLPNTPAPSQEGLQALANATREAGHDTPDFITVVGALPAQAAQTQQRLAAITQAFVHDGVDARLLRPQMRPSDAKSYAESKDSYVIQLAYGQLGKR
jgi:hypothetical protein